MLCGIRYSVNQQIVVLGRSIGCRKGKSVSTVSTLARTKCCLLHHGCDPMQSNCYQVALWSTWRMTPCWVLSVGSWCWQTEYSVDTIAWLALVGACCWAHVSPSSLPPWPLFMSSLDKDKSVYGKRLTGIDTTGHILATWELKSSLLSSPSSEQPHGTQIPLWFCLFREVCQLPLQSHTIIWDGGSVKDSPWKGKLEELLIPLSTALSQRRAPSPSPILFNRLRDSGFLKTSYRIVLLIQGNSGTYRKFCSKLWVVSIACKSSYCSCVLERLPLR